METRDESIVWDQYATYVAADGSFFGPTASLAPGHDDSSEALGNGSNDSSCCY
jgi:hypothetical protein